MKNLIEQLKDNEKPFGLMSEEMQEKAAAMGLLDNFQLFVGPGWGGVFKATGCSFQNGKVYRLRPDYEDDLEIVEHEIFGVESHLHFHYQGTRHSVCQAYDQPNFIGFKFEDGKVRPVPIVYRPKGIAISCCWDVETDSLAAYEVLHATHVLFRRKKQE